MEKDIETTDTLLHGDAASGEENKKNSLTDFLAETAKEPYIASPPGYEGSWLVEPDNLFVLGDNRNRSSDSHVWGFVPMSDVVGRAVVIYWPPGRIRALSHQDLLVQAASP